MPSEAKRTKERGGANNALGWALTIGLNIIAPIITYNQLTEHGYAEFTALLISAGWPVVDLAVYLAWRRRVDEFAAISLLFLALTIVVTLAGPHDAHFLLVKDSLITGLFGVVCLASLAAPRPLMFYFGRKFATDGSAESLERWNGLWQLAGFRRVQRNLTIGWGVAYLVEAALRVGLSYVLSTDAMQALNTVLSIAVTVLLVTWTVSYAKRARAKGAAAAAARAAEAAGAAGTAEPAAV
ncbi:VC0807 family protein [Kitasatospora sp. NPDC093806]|uniref:VC0807 family protein n=1 Tax=Kitasatospora sp. NPDC093806 TaxID=3155075 RepID=UPI00341BFBD2